MANNLRRGEWRELRRAARRQARDAGVEADRLYWFCLGLFAGALSTWLVWGLTLR